VYVYWPTQRTKSHDSFSLLQRIKLLALKKITEINCIKSVLFHQLSTVCVLLTKSRQGTNCLI
jgi:hypothetical protein